MHASMHVCMHARVHVSVVRTSIRTLYVRTYVHTYVDTFTVLFIGVMQIRYLGLAGGSSIAETVRAVMKRLMTSNLAQKMDWKGIGGKETFATLSIRATVCGLCL